MKTKLPALCFFVAIILGIFGCATISPFDQFAYVQTTTAKVEVLDLMEKSSESYMGHEKEVEAVNSTLFKLIEYEKHRPKNAITINMWKKLFDIDSTGNINERSIIPSYWAKWKNDGMERKIFIKEAKAQVAEGFDIIAELEAQKIKPSDAKVTTFLSNN